MAPAKYFEKCLSIAANGAWAVFSGVNKVRPAQSFTPTWSEKPLLKSWEKPSLPWVARRTDSLCPACVREARQQSLTAGTTSAILLKEKVGEIKALFLSATARS